VSSQEYLLWYCRIATEITNELLYLNVCSVVGLCNRSICVVISVWRETLIDYRYMKPQWFADVKFIVLETEVSLCYCVL